jgi:predicted dehydrogenase
MIGVGRIANQRQIPGYRNAGLHIAAVCDVNREVLEGTQERWGITRGFDDHRRLLDDPEVRIVDVLTNTFPRKRIVLDAIAAGKHVLSEKPFARSHADALEMVEAAERARVLLAVHQPTRRYYPFALAKVLIDRGYIGEPFLFIDEMHGEQDRVYYENPVTRWHSGLDDHLHVEWGAHHFDIIRHLAGRTPTSVHCLATRMPGQNFKSEMVCLYSVAFPGALRASLIMNQVMQANLGKWTFRIDGTRGAIFIPWISDRLELYSTAIGDEPYRFHWDNYESVTGLNGIVGGHAADMVDFVNAAATGAAHPSSGRDNLETVCTYLAAKRSAAEGRAVDPREMRD